MIRVTYGVQAQSNNVGLGPAIRPRSYLEHYRIITLTETYWLQSNEIERYLMKVVDPVLMHYPTSNILLILGELYSQYKLVSSRVFMPQISPYLVWMLLFLVSLKCSLSLVDCLLFKFIPGPYLHQGERKHKWGWGSEREQSSSSRSS